MSKSIAIAAFIIIILAGFILLGLDILDIAEDFRLDLPIATINTILISAVAVPVVYYSTKIFIKSGSAVALGLSGAVLAFGFSILLYGWLTDTDLNTRITAYDTGVFFAAVMHSLGAACLLFQRETLISNSTSGRTAVSVIIYLVLLLVISLITWLAHEDIITFIVTPIGANLYTRDIVQGIAFILCFGSALVYMRNYFKTKVDSSFWYSLGLVLFAAGVIFISRGPLESRIAWLGRLSEYAGGIYMLIAALGFYRQIGKDNKNTA